MYVTGFIAPLLFTLFTMQTSKVFIWEPFGLSCSSTLPLTETQNAESWELEDDPFYFWLEAERIPVSDYDEGWINGGAKLTALKVAEEGGYVNVQDGGPIPNVPAGHFVTSFEEGMTTYIIIIIDLKSNVVYEIYLDDELERKPYIYQILNSLRFI